MSDEPRGRYPVAYGAVTATCPGCGATGPIIPGYVGGCRGFRVNGCACGEVRHPEVKQEAR